MMKKTDRPLLNINLTKIKHDEHIVMMFLKFLFVEKPYHLHWSLSIMITFFLQII